MTEEEKQPMRRIDVTQNGITERYFAARSDDDPKWWILYSPSDWIETDTSAWELCEGDDGERIFLWGQTPPNTSWKWIDAAPTPDAYEELADKYAEEYQEKFKSE